MDRWVKTLNSTCLAFYVRNMAFSRGYPGVVLFAHTAFLRGLSSPGASTQSVSLGYPGVVHTWCLSGFPGLLLFTHTQYPAWSSLSQGNSRDTAVQRRTSQRYPMSAGFSLRGDPDQGIRTASSRPTRGAVHTKYLSEALVPFSLSYFLLRRYPQVQCHLQHNVPQR